MEGGADVFNSKVRYADNKQSLQPIIVAYYDNTCST